MGWSKEESLLLEEAVLTVGKVDMEDYLKVSWPAVREWLQKRGVNHAGKSCRLRYQNQLAPDLNRSNMTPNEDEAIMFWAKRWGNKWSKIARLISIESQDAGRRTDNMVKNRFMSNLRTAVVPVRLQAVKACKAGRPSGKHLRVMAHYIAGLTDMRDWVQGCKDIKPKPEDMQRLEQKICNLQALAKGRKPSPTPECMGDSHDSVAVTDDSRVMEAPSPCTPKRRCTASPDSDQAMHCCEGRAMASLSSSYKTPPPAVPTAPHIEGAPSCKWDGPGGKKAGQEQNNWDSPQVMGGFTAFNITADSTMLQKWEQDEFLCEHAQYLQATAALTSPPLPLTAVASTGLLAYPSVSFQVTTIGSFKVDNLGSPRFEDLHAMAMIGPDTDLVMSSPALDLENFTPMDMEDDLQRLVSGPMGLETDRQ